MTERELSQLYYLNREIQQKNKWLQEFEKHRISGLPHIKNVNDPQTVEQLTSCKMIIEAKRQNAIDEYSRLIKYIESIDDSLMRQIISLRYINRYDWKQIAARVGGGNTADGIRVMHSRFLRQDRKKKRK